MPWFTGLRIYAYPNDEINRSIFLTGCYEPSGFYILGRLLKPHMTFVDVGANLGLYTLFAAQRIGHHGLVVAIEPSRREFHRLRSNVEANGLRNVCLLQMAVSNYPREADLLIAEEQKAGHNTLGAFGYPTKMQSIEQVNVETLDRIVCRESLRRVDVVKMDIEGAEFCALLGASETLAKFHPALFLELSDRTLQHQGASSRQVWDFLVEREYRIYVFDGATGLPAPAQPRDYFDAENIIAIHKSSGPTAPW
jgi:FkbM family methyltransferase